MDALSAGLKKGEKEIDAFAANGSAALANLEKMLSSIGVSLSTNNIKKSTADLQAQRVETEKGKTAILEKKAAVEAERAATQAAITANIQNKAAIICAAVATQDAKTATEQNRAAVVQAKAATEQNTASLVQQKKATEANKTAAAALTIQINQQRLANIQNKSVVAAANGSYTEAQRRLTELGKEIRNTEGGFIRKTAALRANIKEYRAINEKLKEFDTLMGNNQRRVGSYKDALNGFSGQLESMAMSYVSLYAVMAGFKKAAGINSEVSDSLSDVQRTAELTANEANNLSESLKKVNTRTTLKGLIDLAGIGGQMGVAKDELVGFSRAIDMLSVTLAKEISGGPEAVATALGKINGVFKVQQKEGTNVEQSLNKTGSAILKLGQLGLATGEFLQDFSLRTAGVAQVMKLSVPNMLAYGATLEEAGSSAEVAGTAVVRLMGDLSSKREQFYAIAKLGDASLTLQQFADLINTDAQKALSLFFSGLKAGNPTATEFSDRLDTIKIKAGPSKNAIIALAENQDKLNKRIAEGTKAYDDGSLAADQFAVKNDNLAANIDKMYNSISNLVTNGRFSEFLNAMAKNVTNFFNELSKLVNSRTWGEFWDRFTHGIDYGNNLDKDIKIKTTFSSVTKRNEDNNHFVTGGGSTIDENKLRDLGADNYNRYLAKVKETFIESAKAYTDYKRAVVKGELERNDQINKSYSDQYDKARYTYSNLLTLQKKLGYTPKVKTAPVTDTTITLPGEGDKKSGRQLDAVTNQLREFQNKSNLITKEGLTKDLQEWEDKYEKIKAIIAKMPAGPAKASATQTLELNYKDGRAGIIDANTKKITDSLNKRNAEIARLEYDGSAKEIEAIKDNYNEQIRLAEGNKEGIVALRKQMNEEITKVQRDQSVKDKATMSAQIADIAKDYREHRAEMLMLGESQGPVAVEIAENERAKDELKRQYADRLIDFETFQDRMKGLIEKGNDLEVKPPKMDYTYFKKQTDEITANLSAFKERIINEGVADTLGETFSAIGSAMVEGGNVFAAAGQAIVASISGFLSELGQMLIKKGAATVAAGVALNIIVPGSGSKQVAGGLALMAAGAAMSLGSGAIGSIGSGKGSNGKNSSSGPEYGVPHFAKGALAYGPTLAMVGDNPGANHDPEVIAPLSKLKGMIGDRSSGGSPTFIISNEISMGKLVTAIRRQEENDRRG